MRTFQLTAAGLIIIICFTAYANSLGGRFLWDDIALIQDNLYIRHWSGLSRVFTSDWGAGSGERYNYYRPLTLLTFMADRALWGSDVRGYHLTNIILHALTALSVCWLVNILSGDRLLSLFTAVLFSAHPVHAEAVAYTSGRVDSLCALFIVLTLVFYIRALDSGRPADRAAAAFGCGLALLSKESGLMLLPVLLLYHFVFRRRFRIAAVLPVAAVSVIYLVLRTAVMKETLLEPSDIMTSFARIPAFFAAITRYMRILLLPLDLHADYGKGIFVFFDPRAAAGIAISVSLLVRAFRRRSASAWLSFGIFWFFLNLLPVSGIRPLAFYMAEHFLYLPSIGLFMVPAYGMAYLYRKAAWAGIISLLILTGVYCGLTIKQNRYWSEPAGFYERTLIYNPESAMAAGNLARIYKDRGDADEAVALLKRTIELEPGRAAARYNLAAVYSDLGKKDDAMAAFRKAIDADPGYIKAYNGLAALYAMSGRPDEAEALLVKALEMDPLFADALSNLGQLYVETGRQDEAEGLFRKALEVDSSHRQALYNLGNVCLNTDRPHEAAALYENLINLYPDRANARITAPAHANLAVAYYRERQYKAAIEHYDRAIELGHEADPGFLRALEEHRE